MRILLILSLLFSSAASADFKVPFKQFELENGLKVILVPQKTSPVACVQVFYRVGGIDEDDSVLGISHFLEHMMFKTSKNLKAGEYSYIIKSRGGYDNAYTSYDYTSYYNVLPVSELETGLRLEAERMSSLTFDEKELSSERNVVIEERHNRYENSPFGFLWEKANQIYFKNHPYGRPVIGNEKTIKNIDSASMKKYYARFYNPGNSILVVAGNFETDRALDLIKKYFQPIPKNQDEQKENLYAVKKWNPAVGIEIFKKEGQTSYGIGFIKIPSISSKMVPSLILLDNILFKGNNSVMNRSLVLDQKFCHSAQGGSYLRKLDSAFLFQFVPVEGVTIETIIEAFEKELKKLKTSKEFKKVVEKSKKFILTEFYTDLQKSKGLTESFGWGAVLQNDPEFLFKVYKQISNLKEKDIKNTLDYMLSQKMSVFVLEPKK